MAIMRWAPFSAFTSLERELQSLLERFTVPTWVGVDWKPTTDVYKANGDLVVEAELPGIDPQKDLDIEVEGNVLHIKGERRVEREIDEADRYLKECRYGAFRREVLLPEGVDAADVRASYADGVLRIEVALPAEPIETPQRVKVAVSAKEKQAV